MAENPYSVTPLTADAVEGELTTTQRLESWVAGGLVGFFSFLLLGVFCFGVVLLVTGRLDVATATSTGTDGAFGGVASFCIVFSVGVALVAGINTTVRLQRALRRRSLNSERKLKLAHDAVLAKEELAKQKAE